MKLTIFSGTNSYDTSNWTHLTIKDHSMYRHPVFQSFPSILNTATGDPIENMSRLADA